MPGRVNTKFVVILAATLLVVSTAVGGLWWYAYYRRDASRYLANARQAMKDGDYETAARQMGRAQMFEKNAERKIAILIELADVYGKITVESQEEANQRLNQIQSCWNNIRNLDPRHPQATTSILEFNYERAKMYASAMPAWDRLYNVADDMLNIVPDLLPAKRYRGYAQVARMAKVDIDDDGRLQARRDLEDVLAANPDDAEVTYQLAVWRLVEADTQRRLGRDAKAEELATEAMQMVRDYRSEHPDSVEAEFNLMRALVVLANRPKEKDQALLDEAKGLLDSLEKKLASGEQADKAMEMSRYLIGLDGEVVKLDDGSDAMRGMIRAEKLLRNVVRQNPDNVEALVTLGSLLRQQGRVDDAIEFYRLAKKDRPIPISLEAPRLSQYQSAANMGLAEMYLAKYQTAETEEAKAADLAQARAEAAELATRAPGSGAVDLIEGKLAYVDGDLLKAVKLLDKANGQFEGRNVDALRLAAQALLQLGETGAAASRLEQLIATGPGSQMIRPYLDLARLDLRQNNVDRAKAYLDVVLKAQPANTDALLLKSELLARQSAALSEAGDPRAVQVAKEAADAVRAVADTDNSTVVQQLVRLEQIAGNNDKARDLLADYYQKHQDDIIILQQLVRLERQLGHEDAAIKLVEDAIQREPDRKVLQVIYDSLKGNTTAATDQIEEVLQADQGDPVVRQLKLYSFYLQTERPDEAKKYLDEAIAKWPDDQRVLELQFNQMLAAKDWDNAQELAQRAAALNNGEGLDQAQGRFWLGRLQLARQEYRQAIGTLEQAVDDMPVSSTGWMLLGDAKRGGQDLNGAETAYRQSLQLKPENAQVWQRLFAIHSARNQHEQAINDLQQVLRYSGGDRNVYMAYLDYLARFDDPAAVLAQREKIAERMPDDQANLRAIAQLHLQLNSPEKAGKVIDHLMELAPDDRANIWVKAQYLAATGAYDQGERLIRDYVHGQDVENPTDNWLMFARYLRAGNRRDAAIAAYKQAIEHEDAAARPASRELADWFFTDRVYDQAAPVYEQILAGSDRSDAGVWRRYIDALVQSDELDKAAAELKQLLTKHDADAQMKLLEGLIAEKRSVKAREAGQTAEADRYYDAAEAAYDEAVHLEQANPTAYIQRARFRMNSKVPTVFQTARADLERAVELNQTNVIPREMLVRWHLVNKDPGAAIDELKRLIIVQPKYLTARVQLAQLLVSRGSTAAGELRTLVEDSERQLPDLPVWDELRAQLPLLRLPAGATLVERANAYRERAADLAKAYAKEKVLQRAVPLINAHLMGIQGDAALKVLNDWPEQLAQSPELQAMRARAIALHGPDHAEQAKAVFAKAFEMAGTDARRIRSVIMQAQAALPPADQIALFEPKIADDDTGFTELMVCQLMLRNKPDEALQRMIKLHERLPDNMDILRALASSCYSAGRLEESAKYYRELLKTNPDDMMALNNLAYMLAEDLSRPAEAIPLAEQATQLVGRDEIQRANVLDTLGWVQYLAGQLEQATGTLRTSVQLNATATNCMHLATVLVKRNQPILAREELIRARRLAEESKDKDTLEKVESLLKSLESSASAE